MPLRDHFRPPLADTASWEELHGGWPMVIVQQLRKTLPPGYVAGPKVRPGDPSRARVVGIKKGSAGACDWMWHPSGTTIVTTTRPRSSDARR